MTTALADLVAADTALAQTASAEASASGGRPEVIAAAQAKFASGLTAASAGNVFGAIGLFRSAWQTALGT